jgi:hypothetical protein
MLSRTFRAVLQSTTRKTVFSFSSHDEPPPTSLPKVSEVVYDYLHIESIFLSETDMALWRGHKPSSGSRCLRLLSEIRCMLFLDLLNSAMAMIPHTDRTTDLTTTILEDPTVAIVG